RRTLDRHYPSKQFLFRMSAVRRSRSWSASLSAWRDPLKGPVLPRLRIGSSERESGCTTVTVDPSGRKQGRTSLHPEELTNREPRGRGNLLGTKDAKHALEERRAVLRRPGQPGDRFLQARTARAGQRQGRLVLMRVEHDLVPQLGGKRTAGDLLHMRAVVIADPHSADVMGRVAYEPRISEALRGASLSGGDMVWDCRLLAGAACNSCAQHVVHGHDIGWHHHLAEGRALPRVQHFAVAVADAGDDVRKHALAAIGERRIGAGELEQRHLRRAERDRGIVL